MQTGQLTLSNGAALTSIAQASGNGSPIAINAETVVADGGSAFNLSQEFSRRRPRPPQTPAPAGRFPSSRENSSCTTARMCSLDPALPGPAAHLLRCPSSRRRRRRGRRLGRLPNHRFRVIPWHRCARDRECGKRVRHSRRAGHDRAWRQRSYLNIGRHRLDDLRQRQCGKCSRQRRDPEPSPTMEWSRAQRAAGAAGNSGSVSVDVSGTLSIDGSGGFPNTRTGILGDTHSAGRGGDVTVIADGITIGEFGYIASDVDIAHSGHGGNVMVTANNVSIGGSGQISSSTFAAAVIAATFRSRLPMG